MSTDINFAFIPFQNNLDDNNNLEVMGATQFLICPTEIYTSITEDGHGSRILHLEFTANRQNDRTKLSALLSANNIRSELVSITINDTKFSGIIKRAKLSKAIKIYDTPDENDEVFSVISLRVVLLVLEIEDKIWQKIVG